MIEPYTIGDVMMECVKANHNIWVLGNYVTLLLVLNIIVLLFVVLIYFKLKGGIK